MIELRIIGVPKPGGSKRAFVAKSGKIAMVDMCKQNREWRNSVIIQAREQYDGAPLTGPLRIDVSFYMPRPQSHYRTGKHAGRLKDAAPLWHTSKPDVLKLMRSTEDALTDAGIWRDDALVSEQSIRKYYAVEGRIGAIITIEQIEGEE